MAETKWIVWTLPSTALEEALRGAGNIVLTLSLPSDDPSIIAKVEAAAQKAGMSITRLDA
jgi:hypothetical protein